MEGIGSEAASLAGHLGLDDLCWIYDNNHITIEGKTRITFTEDVATRFLAYQWNVLRVGDANDLQRIEDAIAVFRKTEGRPTLIILDSHIGYGSPHKVDTSASPRRAPGRRRGSTRQARLWLAGERQIPRTRRRGGALCLRDRRAGVRRRGATGKRFLPTTASNFPISPPRSIRCNGASCPPGGTATCRASRRMPRESPDATPPAKCSMCSPRNIPWLLGGSADLASFKQDGAEIPWRRGI